MLCRFCGKRDCYRTFPLNTPEHVIRAYKGEKWLATCEKGQAYEKKTIGFCYRDIMTACRLKEQYQKSVEITKALKPQYSEITRVARQNTMADIARNTLAKMAKMAGKKW